MNLRAAGVVAIALIGCAVDSEGSSPPGGGADASAGFAGVSGVGGGIRTAIRSSLTRRRREGKIRAFAGGEKWHVCEPEAQAILAECPALERESDLNMHNEGVTIVLL